MSFENKRTRTLAFGLFTALAAAFSTSRAAADEGVYQEEDGLLVIEFESAMPGGDWAFEQDVSRSTGSGYLRWDGPNLFNSPGQGAFGFDFEIHDAGTYDFRVRNFHDHPDSTEENDVWVRLDGRPWMKLFSGINDQWNWASNFDVSQDHKPEASYELTAGQHRIEFSGRSHNFHVDRFHMYIPGTPGGLDMNRPESECVYPEQSPIAAFEVTPRELPEFDNHSTVITLDASRSCSSDPENTNLNFKWRARGARFVNGTNRRSPVAQVTFEGGQAYPIRLTVSDADGLEDRSQGVVGVEGPDGIQGWEGMPERVDPIRPTVTHVDVYPGNTYVIEGESFTGSPSMAYAAVNPLLDQDETVVIGVHGDCGVVELGFGWSSTGGRLFKDPDGVRVAFIGKDDDAEVSIRFFGKPEGPEGDAFDDVEVASFFDIGIRGLADSFIVRQSGYIRHITFDNFWMLNNVNAGPGQMHSSGFHLHRDWETLTLKGYQARETEFTNHTFYLKPGGFWQVLDCELWGGNRTGFQARPHPTPVNPDMSATPHGACVIDGNIAESFGRNHGGASGGQWITVWASLEYPVRISNNVCTDARYGCLAVVQGTTGNALLTDDGWAHTNVYMYGNTFENNGGDRDCVMFAGVERIHVGPANDFASAQRAMTLGSQWSHLMSESLDIGELLIYGASSFPTFDVWEFLRLDPQYRLMSVNELESMLVDQE